MFKKIKLYFLGIVLLLITPELTTLVYSQTTVFGPELYTRDTGKPQKIVKSFSANTGWVPFAISVKNGNGKKEKASSAVVDINGQSILNPDDFSKEISEIIVLVKLKAQNEIAVEVRGEPGTFITVTILGNSEPEISGYAEPDYVNLSIDTTVTILAFLEKPNPTSINLAQYDSKYMPVADLGILYDDGTHGDRKAGDNDFTAQIAINRSSTEMLYYRISALYKKSDGTFRNVLSNFFSVNAAHIPSVTGIVSPQGGTMTLEGYAIVTFPAGAFTADNTVTISATLSPESQSDFEDTIPTPHLPYEIRINSGYVAPVTSFDVIVNIPDSFIASLPTNYKVEVYAQYFEPPDAPEIYGHFEDFPSTFDQIAKTVSTTLPKRIFSTMHHIDDTYEVVIIVGTFY